MFIFPSFIWTSSTDGPLKRWPFKYLWLPKDFHRNKMTNLKKKENLNWITSFIICCTQHTLQDSLLFNLFRFFLTGTEGLVCFLIDKQVAHTCVSLYLKEKSWPRTRWWNRPNMNLRVSCENMVPGKCSASLDQSLWGSKCVVETKRGWTCPKLKPNGFKINYVYESFRLWALSQEITNTEML